MFTHGPFSPGRSALRAVGTTGNRRLPAALWAVIRQVCSIRAPSFRTRLGFLSWRGRSRMRVNTEPPASDNVARITFSEGFSHDLCWTWKHGQGGADVIHEVSLCGKHPSLNVARVLGMHERHALGRLDIHHDEEGHETHLFHPVAGSGADGRRNDLYSCLSALYSGSGQLSVLFLYRPLSDPMWLSAERRCDVGLRSDTVMVGACLATGSLGSVILRSS